MEYLNFSGSMVLRRLTFRVPFPELSVLSLEVILRALSTIVSPAFSEFTLELGKLPSQFSRHPSEHWGRWNEIDKLFGGQLGERGDFRLIVRTGKLYDRETFRVHAQESFPLLARRGCIRFETSHSIDEYWR